MTSGDEPSVGYSTGRRAGLAAVGGVLLTIQVIRLSRSDNSDVLTLGIAALVTVALVWGVFRFVRRRANQAVERVLQAGALAAWPALTPGDDGTYRVLAADVDGVHVWRPRKKEMLREQSVAWAGLEVAPVQVRLRALTWNGLSAGAGPSGPGTPAPNAAQNLLVPLVVAPNPRVRMFRGGTQQERDAVIERLRELAASRASAR